MKGLRCVRCGEAMIVITPTVMPRDALLRRYEQDGSFTDCYCMELPGVISMAEYIAAFYTTALFKVERRILALAAGTPSTDRNAEELVLGQASSFSAWKVEDRTANQLLLSDIRWRTRSWLMVEPMNKAGSSATRLYFGSAVLPTSRPASGKSSLGFVFHALSGFHHLYTRALMRAAQMKLSGRKK